MAELNYVPNASARSLANNSTKTIGFTIARPADQAFANPFFGELIRGIATVSQRRDYKLMLSMSSNPEWEIKDCLQMVREKRVDGLILSTVRVNDPLVEALVAEEVPFVVIGRSLEFQVPIVNNDNIMCGKIAAGHLLERGKKRLAFLSGSQDLVVSQDRIEGFAQALKSEGLDLTPHQIIETSFTREGGWEAMDVLLGSGLEFDGIIAADDLIALGAIEWLKAKGMDIPADVGVVGFNDDPVAAFVSPPLTSVRISTYDLGVGATKMLLDILAGTETPQSLLVPAELVVRQSS
jgi:DNA-binding LacI/PurR family transcriptional regulator